MVANMKIEQDKENPGIHKVYQDGNEIKCITEVSLNINTDSFPEVNITIGGGCDFEGMADVHFDYSPYTVKEACKILREEIMKRNDLFDGFVSSIQTAIEEAPNYIKNRELAERILKRIIGEESNERKD